MGEYARRFRKIGVTDYRKNNIGKTPRLRSAAASVEIGLVYAAHGEKKLSQVKRLKDCQGFLYRRSQFVAVPSNIYRTNRVLRVRRRFLIWGWRNMRFKVGARHRRLGYVPPSLELGGIWEDCARSAGA